MAKKLDLTDEPLASALGGIFHDMTAFQLALLLNTHEFDFIIADVVREFLRCDFPLYSSFGNLYGIEYWLGNSDYTQYVGN